MERIGMIQSLFFYETGRIWEVFFQNAGYETVRSQQAGTCSLNITEACQPIQNCLSHIQNLTEQHLDWIFIPRVVSYVKGYCSCPKIQGVCDAARMLVPKSMNRLEPVLDARKGPYDGVYQVGKQLGIPARAAKYIYKETLDQFRREPMVSEQPYIAFLGHPYVLQDPQLGEPIIRYFKDRGYGAVMADEQPDTMLLQKGRALQERKMFWYTGQKLIGYCQMLSESSQVPDGIIYVSVFGCGIDEYIWPYCEKIIGRKRPFLHLKLDRQYHGAGLVTRLEAFQDMIERNRKV